jgi:molybdopterin biosynthesis enzyme
MALLRVEALPGNPLAAAATFHGRELPRIIAALGGTRDALTIVFAPADHTHSGWRLAVVQELARQRAPRRVNAVAGDDEAAIVAADRYLEAANGVTGQLLPLDSHGAGAMVYPAA